MWKIIKKKFKKWFNSIIEGDFPKWYGKKHEFGSREFMYDSFLVPYLQTCHRYALVGITTAIALFFIQNAFGARFVKALVRTYQRRMVSHFEDTETIMTFERSHFYLYPLVLSFYLLLISVCNYKDLTYFTEYAVELEYLVFRGVNVRPSFVLDTVSSFFLITTIGVGVWANYFSSLYMKGDYNENRFEILLNSFLFSMLFLILASDLVTFLFFWELIGFTSFFLINFYSKKASTFKSAMKAFTYNQISDVCLVTSTILYYKAFGTFRFPNSGIDRLTTVESSSYLMSIMVLFFFIAASCKSVQFFLHFWLPDSMDAPVPASALIHSATLVAAGVYLVLRVKPLFMWSQTCVNLFSYLSLVTIMVGGLAATAHMDLKKILAYSTISNCGYMMFFAINSKEIDTLVFFSTHGLLKGLSFIFIGLIIFDLNHRQDVRYSVGLGYLKPCVLVGVLITVGTLGSLPTSIMAAVKHDAIYNTSSYNTNHIFTNMCLAVGSLTSLVYSLKIILLVFFFGIFKTKLTDTKRISFETLSINKLIILGSLLQMLIVLYVLVFFFIKPDFLHHVYTNGILYMIEPAKPTLMSDSFVRNCVVIGQYASVIMISAPMFYKTPFWWNTIAHTALFILICTSCLTI